jgi:hypothetical protein
MAGQGGALATSAPDDAADRPTARHVEAALTFVTPSDRKPVFHSSAYTGGVPKFFFETERHVVALNSALCCFRVTPTFSRPFWTGQPLAYPAVQNSGAAAGLAASPKNTSRRQSERSRPPE